MPTYEYVCEKCGHAFDCVQSITAAPLTVCPKDRCGQKRWGRGKVRRGVGGGAGLIFKGSGFYITDYRSEGYKAAAKKESSAGSGSSGGESKTSATKSESSSSTSTSSTSGASGAASAK